MTKSKSKIYTLLLFIATILCIVLIVISFWNIILKTGSKLSVWPLVYLFLSIISLSVFYTRHIKLTDEKTLDDLINKKVDEERTKILSELNKKEETSEIIDESLKKSNKIEQIMPKGKFKSTETYAKKLLNNLADELEVIQGVIFIGNQKNKSFSFLVGYALTNKEPLPGFKLGENINGQVAATKEIMVLNEVPENYFEVESGLGKSKPRNLMIIPMIHNGHTIGILEIATFRSISENMKNLTSKIVDQAAEKLIQIQKS